MARAARVDGGVRFHCVTVVTGQETGVPLGPIGSGCPARSICPAVSLASPTSTFHSAASVAPSSARVARVPERAAARSESRRWRDPSGRATSPARPAPAARRAAAAPPAPSPPCTSTCHSVGERDRVLHLSSPHPRTRRTAPACTPPPPGRPRPTDAWSRVGTAPSATDAGSSGTSGVGVDLRVRGRRRSPRRWPRPPAVVGGGQRVRAPDRPDRQGHRHDPDGSPACARSSRRSCAASSVLRVSASVSAGDRRPGADAGCRARSSADVGVRSAERSPP